MSRQTIVAIGYSGAHEPVFRLFQQLPPTPAAYVLLRHLPSTYHVQLQQIVIQRLGLTVREALPGMALMHNHIYTLPATHYLSLTNGRFYYIRPAAHFTDQAKAVDTFFHSLARQPEASKIAVVLSGYGSDGSEGARKIRQAGGKLLVQHPDTCQHPQMPLAVIQSVMPDEFLFPDTMRITLEAFLQPRSPQLKS